MPRRLAFFLTPLLTVGLAAPLSQAADAPAPPAPSSFLTLNGQATYRQRIALPPDAVFHLKARDGRRTLAEQDISFDGHQVPIAFSLTVDRDLIGPRSRIVLDGRITQGKRTLFAGSAPAGKETAEIVLKPIPRAKPAQ